MARKKKWRLMTHVAESSTEFEMFRRGSGEMFDWISRNQRDMSDCRGLSPIEHLGGAGLLGRNLLATHANYLAPGDAALLARRRVSVVHCPRSHDYFSHKPFPHGALTRAGVNVCLGTDSLATMRKPQRADIELNVFAEMQLFAQKNPGMTSEQILQMATMNGAQALGLERKAGEFSRSAHADLIALPYAGKIADVCDSIVQHVGAVSASMIGGEWAIKPTFSQTR
jgi:cytosine/adenosine deaminase-related metal-dependent hydrolase